MQLEVFADYSQFLLQDEQLRGNLAESWNEQSASDRVAVAPGVIGVGTARNYLVPVTIQVRRSEPEDDPESWDHIAEASLDVPSGRVVIAGPTDDFADSPRLTVTPGTYRVRIYYGGLDTVSPNGLEGSDHYRVVLWPGDSLPPRVLRRR